MTKNKSILSLANNTGFSEVLGKMCDRFSKLYRKKVYVHHYTNFLDESIFTESYSTLEGLDAEYRKLMAYEGSDVVQRYRPLF